MSLPIASGYMNLYLEASASIADGAIPLFIQGSHSGTSYDFANLQLYINGSGFSTSLNLFVNGISQSGEIEEELNLFLEATYSPVSNNIPLILLGTPEDLPSLDLMDLTLQELDDLSLLELDDLPLGYSFSGWPFSNNMSLYINGDGSLDGSIPTSGNLNLYLSGPPGIIGNLPLYLLPSSVASGSIPLNTFGVLGLSSGLINLYTFGVNILNNVNLPFFIRGYDPSEF